MNYNLYNSLLPKMADFSSIFSEKQIKPMLPYNKIYLEYPPVRDLSTNTTKIPLFNRDKNIVDWTIIDTCDEPIVLPFSFHMEKRIKTGKCSYASSNTGMYLHHIIIGEPDSGLLVDHKSGDSLDNRRSNLRFATHSQNSQNVAKRQNCTSKYKGLSLQSTGEFRIRIKVGDVIMCLGYHKDEDFCAKIYDAYATKYYGIDARTNNLLSQELREWIVANDIPEEYKKIEIQKTKRDLPDYIDILQKNLL